jgi:phosphohistidine phosphatase
MQVLVVRHAIAFERNARRWRDDGRRPLSPEGIRKFKKAASGLKRLEMRPQRVLTSPLVRARQTADLLTQFAKWPDPVECAALAPGNAPAQILTELARFKVERIAIVGHEPSLSHFLSACIAGADSKAALEMKKGGVACVSFSGKPRPGAAVLEWLLPPRALRALA